VAIVRASGPAVAHIAAAVFRARTPLAPRVATLGRVVDAAGATIDRGLALHFPAPHSLTGEDVLELHVHGSPATARDTLAAVLAAGARLAGPGEFTRRAFLAGKMDLSAAEAVADVIAAEHRSAARAAAARLGGGLAGAVERVRAALNTTLEELAAAIDFPDEVATPARDAVEARLASADAELAALARTWEQGRLVREGVSVAIVGAPNAGKSSLLNALLEADRALVSDVPGTTRDTLEETLALGDMTARVIDTAGIRAHGGGAGGQAALEAAGIARARDEMARARIALVVVDGSAPLAADARAIVAATRARPRVLFYNKADLGSAAFDERGADEEDGLRGSVFCYEDVARVRERLRAAIGGDDAPDLERPMLANARQVDAVLEARRGLAFALQTVREGAPLDLASGDLVAASAALGSVTGTVATDALLDAIFARFCIGK
jgi:tRNA modification GTPase